MTEKAPEKVYEQICEYPDCENPRPLPMMNEKGCHNFIPHIINGELKNVCMDCKLKFLFNKLKRNGF